MTYLLTVLILSALAACGGGGDDKQVATNPVNDVPCISQCVPCDQPCKGNQ